MAASLCAHLFSGSHGWMYSPSVCSAGETITGELSCKPNDKNPRDLDIELGYSFEGKHGQCTRTQQYRMR